MAECLLLEEHGPPGEIACRLTNQPEQVRRLSYSCSLCRLCRKVCPQGLDPAGMFLALRRESIALGETDLRRYRRLLSFEKAGASRLFSALIAPADCRSLFFPGCALPGARPTQTLQLYRALRGIEPSMGIMLDCCHKPSHDIGRQDFFLDRFKTRLARLADHGIQRIVTTCPSCYEAFSSVHNGPTVISAYSLLAGSDVSPAKRFDGLSCSIHDPCSIRFAADIQADVRNLCDRLGLSVVEMSHSGATTLCCGEGAGVGFTDSRRSDAWKHKRLAEAGNRTLVTYCAGCTARLGGNGRTHHLVDLLFAAPGLDSTPLKPVHPLRSWLNRILVKFLLMKAHVFRT